MITRIVMLAALLALSCAPAQTGQKPVQIIVPFAPGASADGIARTIASELGPRLGRQIVVENKPGAGGSLGLTVLAKSPPDGDTLSVGATGALVIGPHLPGAPPLDPLRELAPIAKLIDVPLVVVANPATGPKTIREMIERAKASPGGLSYATTGPNSSMHLTMELLKKATGANLVHVPYRGSAPAVTDAVAGQIPVAVVDLTSAHSHIRAGTLLALGVPHAKRTALLPDIPTIAEAGVAGFWAHRRVHRAARAGRHAGAGREAAVARGRSDPCVAGGAGQGAPVVGRTRLSRRCGLCAHAGRGIGEVEGAAGLALARPYCRPCARGIVTPCVAARR